MTLNLCLVECRCVCLFRASYNAYTKLNLRYSQNAPLSMYEEVNTKTNLPAQIDLFSIPGNQYKFMFMAKGGGSANKSYLFQETKALLTPERLMPFIEAKIKSLGTAACPRTISLSSSAEPPLRPV